jgi:hypothetical protein
MQENPVFIFGAGASKACGGPLTDEILYDAFCNDTLCSTLDRLNEIELVRRCLTEHFHVPKEGARAQDYPPLTLFMSLLDLAIERNRPLPMRKPEFPKGIGRQELTRIRATIEYIIFAVLDYYLRTPIGGAYRKLLYSPLIDPKIGPRAISLNYDIILDNLMCEVAQRHDRDAAPGYGCDIRTEAYARKARYGKLLKLHGSLNWMFCPGCQRLDIGMSASGATIADSSLLRELYNFKPLERHYLCSEDSCDECQCKFCGTPLRAVMITPSFVKDYRNPHIQRVWYEAEQLLRESTHCYIIGYSLPNDDLEVIHLLRRGVESLPPQNITVVLQDPDDSTLRRYRSLFGPEIGFEKGGFEEWSERIASTPVSQIASAS